MAQSSTDKQGSVRKVVQNGGLAKTLNTLRTVPGAPNPFVTAQQRRTSSGQANTGN